MSSKEFRAAEDKVNKKLLQSKPVDSKEEEIRKAKIKLSEISVLIREIQELIGE